MFLSYVYNFQNILALMHVRQVGAIRHAISNMVACAAHGPG